MSLHRLALGSVVALAIVASWAPLAAQSAPADSARNVVSVVAAPTQLTNTAPTDRTLFLAPVRATAPSESRQVVAAAAVSRAVESSGNSRNMAMMLVGGAGLVVGALVGGNAGTVIMVGGGVVGLLGLWNYLK